MSHEKRLSTVGEIARQLRVPVHRVEYIIRSRKIAPLGRAGNARVFAESAVEWISDVLTATGDVTKDVTDESEVST